MPVKKKGRCLLVLTALRFSEGYAAAALASARRRGEEVVLCLVEDGEVSETVSHRLLDGGALGERLVADLRATIDHDQSDRGHWHLEEVRAEAAALGLSIQTREISGEFVASVRKVARELEVDRILVARAGRTRIARALGGSRIERLRRASDCPVVVFELSGEQVSGLEEEERASVVPPESPGSGPGGTR
ncbi:MAG: hypothetical protein DHS20C21_16420 [Gemmatimonadota bacterium]|nr:MAG: hypothetical protein DHS20C21_16420 [Gemmatimonadota bacterium]